MLKDIINSSFLNTWLTKLNMAMQDTQTYVQCAVVVVLLVIAFVASKSLKRVFPVLNHRFDSNDHPFRKAIAVAATIIEPFLAMLLLKIAQQVLHNLSIANWLVSVTLSLLLLFLCFRIISRFVSSPFPAVLFKWIGLPVLFMHLVGVLPIIIDALDDIAISAGNVSITAYGVARVLLFGGILFWLGRLSNSVGKAIIRKQEALDVPTKEVFTKLFEVSIFCIVFLLLLNVMGINLTTLAVFGGALGVGIGLGLQSIASNFISGIIILLDKSLTIGDFVELDDGNKGFVREFRMRYAVLETYDGKDILVPNEKFISDLIVNWSHKDPKQRYRVDFCVAYSTDIRSMVEIVKEAVATHPKVISGPEIPFEERPDCEIDSFGDSGVNMFVEFWMEGIDDGKNRVGGDLLLQIFETLKEHDIQIPFPQREVRIL